MIHHIRGHPSLQFLHLVLPWSRVLNNLKVQTQINHIEQPSILSTLLIRLSVRPSLLLLFHGC